MNFMGPGESSPGSNLQISHEEIDSNYMNIDLPHSPMETNNYQNKLHINQANNNINGLNKIKLLQVRTFLKKSYSPRTPTLSMISF